MTHPRHWVDDYLGPHRRHHSLRGQSRTHRGHSTVLTKVLKQCVTSIYSLKSSTYILKPSTYGLKAVCYKYVQLEAQYVQPESQHVQLWRPVCTAWAQHVRVEGSVWQVRTSFKSNLLAVRVRTVERVPEVYMCVCDRESSLKWHWSNEMSPTYLRTSMYIYIIWVGAVVVRSMIMKLFWCFPCL